MADGSPHLLRMVLSEEEEVFNNSQAAVPNSVPFVFWQPRKQSFLRVNLQYRLCSFGVEPLLEEEELETAPLSASEYGTTLFSLQKY